MSHVPRFGLVLRRLRPLHRDQRRRLLPDHEGGSGHDTDVFHMQAERGCRSPVLVVRDQSAGQPMNEINLDGFVDGHGVRYIGSATRQPDGKYICLADVGGALCRVEVTIVARPTPKRLFEDDVVYPMDDVGPYNEVQGLVVGVSELETEGDCVKVTLDTEFGRQSGFWTVSPISRAHPVIGDTATLRVYRSGGGWYPDDRITGWRRPQ